MTLKELYRFTEQNFPLPQQTAQEILQRIIRQMNKEKENMVTKPSSIQMSPQTVEAAKNGDQFAMSELYQTCYNTIYYIVKSILLEEETTEDIVQDSFMKAFQNLNKLQNPAAFVPWLKRLATNTAKDWLKKKKPILFSSIATEDEEDETEPEFEDMDFTMRPEEALDAKNQKQMLWDIINALSEEQRLVVSMFYFQEMTVAEISADLGVSQGTIKSRLNYARKKIRAKVLDLERGEPGIHGLAPIPLLRWLFMQNQQNNPMAAPADFIGAWSESKRSAASAS